MDPAAYVELSEIEETHWWFVARRQIIAREIERFGLPEDARILEVGCGAGGNLELLRQFGRVSAFEMDPDAVGLANAKATGADVRPGHCPDNIPFTDEQFDLISMFDVLEHIEQDEETLSALSGLLAPGGRMLVTVPAYRWLWGPHDEFFHHKRRYTKEEIRAKAEGAGLRPRRISYFNTLLFPAACATRLKDRMSAVKSYGGMEVPAAPINAILGGIFGAERRLLEAMDLPYGLSLISVFQR